jgi:nitrous oxidase accessory protein NosD
VITILPGTYAENLVLTKAVTITSGRGGAGVVIAPPNGRVVTMAAVSATLRGLTLRGADAECPVVDVPSGALQIEDCLLVGAASSAVLIRHAGTAMIIDCALDNAVGAGLIAAGGSGLLLRCEIGPCATSGIVVLHDADPEIRQCTIRGCMGNGVYASDSSRARIVQCDIAGSTMPAVVLAKNTSTSLTHTTVHQVPGVAIYITSNGAPFVTNSSISDTGREGVLLADGAEATFRDCRVERSGGCGIAVTAESRGRFEDCVVSDVAEDGIRVSGQSRPIFTRVRVSDSKANGVTVVDGAKASFGQLQVADVTGDGAHVASGGRASFERSMVRRTGGHGIVARGGRCELADSEIIETGRAALRVLAAGCVIAQRTYLHRAGAELVDDGQLTLIDCAISAAAGPGIEVTDCARLDMTRVSIDDCATFGVRLTDHAAMQLRDCAIGDNGAGAISDATAGVAQLEARSRSEVPVDVVRADLQRMIGLDNVKREVSDLADLIQVGRQREAFGLPTPPISRHMIFAGPPGTGKTSVGRLYGRLLAALGVLPSGHVVEVSRSDLVAQVVGGTAIKTTERFMEAVGGVFFLDEAYSLTGQERGVGPDFGREAIDTLVKLMEDHRDEVVVIAAGYTVPMRAFVASNPGLASRISRVIEFPSYSTSELVTIVDGMCAEHRYDLTDNARAALAAHFTLIRQEENFGNARAARQLFENMVAAQARRLARRTGLVASDLATLIAGDVLD